MERELWQSIKFSRCCKEVQTLHHKSSRSSWSSGREREREKDSHEGESTGEHITFISNFFNCQPTSTPPATTMFDAAKDCSPDARRARPPALSLHTSRRSTTSGQPFEHARAKLVSAPEPRQSKQFSDGSELLQKPVALTPKLMRVALIQYVNQLLLCLTLHKVCTSGC